MNEKGTIKIYQVQFITSSITIKKDLHILIISYEISELMMNGIL